MGALTTAAKAARIRRDTDNAETAETERAERYGRHLAEYEENVRQAHAEASDALGAHADDITWSRISADDATPYGTHPDLPARLRFGWMEAYGLRLCALPADTRSATTASRPVNIGSPAIASLADLGDALAAWDEDQSTVGR